MLSHLILDVNIFLKLFCCLSEASGFESLEAINQQERFYHVLSCFVKCFLIIFKNFQISFQKEQILIRLFAKTTLIEYQLTKHLSTLFFIFYLRAAF